MPKKTKEQETKDFKALIQRTLVVFKPDAVQRGIIGEILSRFERVGLKIVGMKMVFPDEKHYHEHYEGIGKMITRRGEDAFHDNLIYMVSGPVVAMVLEGVEAVDVVKKISGPTEPKSADMGTIRGDYSHMSFGYSNTKRIGIPNLIHRSGDLEDAKQEVAHWFKSEELFDYSDTADKFVY